MKKTIEMVAAIYECDVEVVQELLDEGFTLEEAEQMLEQIQAMPGGSMLFNFRIEKSPIETEE